jgi:hypothetical protein
MSLTSYRTAPPHGAMDAAIAEALQGSLLLKEKNDVAA